jgi:hypothetical protein
MLRQPGRSAMASTTGSRDHAETLDRSRSAKPQTSELHTSRSLKPCRIRLVTVCASSACVRHAEQAGESPLGLHLRGLRGRRAFLGPYASPTVLILHPTGLRQNEVEGRPGDSSLRRPAAARSSKQTSPRYRIRQPASGEQAPPRWTVLGPLRRFPFFRRSVAQARRSLSNGAAQLLLRRARSEVWYQAEIRTLGRSAVQPVQ